MNIQVQLCGLVLLLVIVSLYFGHKRVGFNTERIFLRVIIVNVLCLSLDVLSVLAIYYKDYLTTPFCNVVCKAYLSSAIMVGFIAVRYVVTDLFNENIIKRIFIVYTLIVFVESVFIFISPISYNFESQGAYTSGISVLLTYIFTLMFILITIYYLLRYRKRIEHRKKIAVIAWMACVVGAAIVQFIYSDFLLVGFGGAIGILLLFVLLDNPAVNVDKQLNCFNAHALMEYVARSYNNDRFFSVIMLSLNQSESFDDDIQASLQVFKRILIELAPYKNIRIFRDLEKRLFIVDDNYEEIMDIYDFLSDNYDMKYLILEDSSILKNSEDFFRVLNYEFTMMDEKDETYLEIGKESVLDIRKKEQTKDMIISAIGENRVEVYYQPIYSFEKDKFVSAEALVRIKDKDGSVISPAEFIPVAEETGIIIELGEIVFKKVCQMIDEEDITKYGIEYIEVNLSVVQCEQSNLAVRFKRILEKYSIDPANINLEITETASMHTKQILLRNMNELMEIGISFSLDDFGNGQSNLDYLIDMPVSFLKIDQNMTWNYFVHDKARYVVEATVDMVHDMKLKMIAEGVETSMHLKAMENIGVDYIQGYFFSRPLPRNSFVEFIKEKNQ